MINKMNQKASKRKQQKTLANMNPSNPKDESDELDCGSFVQIKEQDIGPTSPEEQQTSGLAYRWNMLKSYLDEFTGAPKPL